MTDDSRDRNSVWPPDFGGWWHDLRIAAAFLTRLPIQLGETGGMPALAGTARCFPVVGLGIGLFGGLLYALAIGLDLPPLLAAIIAVAGAVTVTGALHEDGLADTADGFGAAGDRDRKLAIMRDSRIGSYGVIALILALATRIGGLAAFEDSADAVAAFIVCHAASRAFIVAVMHREPLARSDGLAASAGRPNQTSMLLALGIAGLVDLLFAGVDGLAGLVVAAAAAWAVAAIARRQIGGVTGDVLGAVQQGTEVAMLLTLVALD